MFAQPTTAALSTTLKGVVSGALTTTVRVSAAPVSHWATESQQAARRNALVASTALTQQRVDRDAIDEYVDAAAARFVARRRFTAQPA